MLCRRIIDAVGSLFFRIKKQIDHVCLVRFLKFSDHSDCCIVVGDRLILQHCAAYCDCVLVMRVAGSLGWGDTK